ncbi:Scr1 family TA system antitoxin-like transcriptional regulator [Streptomyces sp. NPDC088400]|uniref:helix-turn-helix domain-containing protein n=1 Tax=Streptomyces sp. NPDC088400 TaxID=3365861 RepID=UPI0038267FCB
MKFQPHELHPERSVRDLFGADVRRYREASGLSLVRLAAVLKYSKSHLARIETAEFLPYPDLPPKLDLLFETDRHFARLYEVARRESFPGKYRRATELEAQARVYEEYACATVPGLLQTTEFALRSLRTGHPHTPEGEIERMLQGRLERQKKLRSETPARYWFILDEAVLRRRVGDHRMMRTQLASIIEQSTQSHITVQVLPFASGDHAEMGGTLMLFTIPDTPTMVWLEGSRNGTLIDDPDAVAERRESYDLLRACALSPEDSRGMIRAVMKEYERDVSGPTADSPVA